MAWDPPYTDASRTVGHWTAEVGAVPPQLGATVYRDVFPLTLTEGDANTDGVATATSTATVIAGGTSPTDHPAVDPSDQTTSSTASPPPTGLASGAKAGIAVGVLVSVFGIFGFVVYFLCYRRKKHQSDRRRPRRLNRAARENEGAIPLEAIIRYVPHDTNGGGGDGDGGGGRDGGAVLWTGEATPQVDGGGGGYGDGGRSGNRNRNRNEERGFTAAPVIRRGRSPPPVPPPAPPGSNNRRPPPRPPRPPRPSRTGVFETQM